MRGGATEPGGGVGAFIRYDLRTTDPAGAADFYRAVAELKLVEGDKFPILISGGSRGEDERIVGGVGPLPERARDAGAPAHWLGHVAVTDLDASLDRLVDLGGELLGPLGEDGEGRRFATVRDPQGAVFALTSSVPEKEPPSGSGRDPSGGHLSGDESSGEPPDPDAAPLTVAWHQLNTTDLDAAWAFYSELFGWRKTHTLELGEGIGTYQLFAWNGIEGSAGAMAETARQPHVHLQWAFYLGVGDIDSAADAVRRHGGSVVDGPRAVPGGSRMAYCEDPQGGAFGLREG